MLNGPPLPVNPILFAGTWNIYSKKATPQLINITANKPKLLNQSISLNFKCPYHANVIKVFERIKNKIVTKPLLIFLSFLLKSAINYKNLLLVYCQYNFCLFYLNTELQFYFQDFYQKDIRLLRTAIPMVS